MYNSHQALLYCYKNLKEEIEAYSKLITYNATYSFRTQKTIEIVNDVLRLIGEKNTLVFVKKKMEEAFLSMTQEERQFIEERYFLGKKDKDEVIGNYYRKNANVLYNAVKKMDKAGLTKKFFDEYCVGIPLFEEIRSLLKRKRRIVNTNRKAV